MLQSAQVRKVGSVAWFSVRATAGMVQQQSGMPGVAPAACKCENGTNGGEGTHGRHVIWLESGNESKVYN